MGYVFIFYFFRAMLVGGALIKLWNGEIPWLEWLMLALIIEVACILHGIIQHLIIRETREPPAFPWCSRAFWLRQPSQVDNQPSSRDIPHEEKP
jgi:hypothetical protein